MVMLFHIPVQSFEGKTTLITRPELHWIMVLFPGELEGVRAHSPIANDVSSKFVGFVFWRDFWQSM
jgi:hypothetical protein